jgi:hypothetical protein
MSTHPIDAKSTRSPHLASHLVLALTLAAGCATQQQPPGTTAAASPGSTAASAPRTPDAILADAVEATGGAAWHTHKTARLKLTIAFQGMAMGGPAEHFQTDTDKSLTITTLPGVGPISEGTNGRVFWSQDPVNGLRYLEGAEAEQARIEACWNADLKAHELYQKIEVAPDPPAGLECLVQTPKTGAPIRNCYDRQSHLQVSQEGTRATAQGDVPFRSAVKDWRTVGGIKMAYSSETQAGPITIVTTINDVAFDQPMDDKMFDPPAPAAK